MILLIQNKYHIFLLILNCYGDCLFNTCYKIRKISNGKSKVNLINSHSQQYHKKISIQEFTEIATANSIKIVIITTAVNNSL
jgi:hypothetical protein